MAATRVQGAGGNSGGSGGSGGSVSSISQAYGSPVTAGNILTAAIYWVSGSGTAGETFAFADTLGNTWTVVATGAKSNYHGYTAIAWTTSRASGSNIVTVTPPIAGEMGIMVDEWNAGGNSSFLYQTASAVEQTATPLSTANLTFSGSGPTWLVCGYVFSLYQNTTITGESGYTQGTSFQGTPGFSYLGQYQSANSSASGSPMTATLTNTPSTEGGISAIVFAVLPFNAMLTPTVARDRSQSRRRLWAD